VRKACPIPNNALLKEFDSKRNLKWQSLSLTCMSENKEARLEQMRWLREQLIQERLQTSLLFVVQTSRRILHSAKTTSSQCPFVTIQSTLQTKHFINECQASSLKAYFNEKCPVFFIKFLKVFKLIGSTICLLSAFHVFMFLKNLGFKFAC
jgi:hypothetical protein